MGDPIRIDDLAEQSPSNDEYVIIDSEHGTRKTPVAMLFAKQGDQVPTSSIEAVEGTIFIKHSGASVSAIYRKQSNGSWLQIFPPQ